MELKKCCEIFVVVCINIFLRILFSFLNEQSLVKYLKHNSLSPHNYIIVAIRVVRM